MENIETEILSDNLLEYSLKIDYLIKWLQEVKALGYNYINTSHTPSDHPDWLSYTEDDKAVVNLIATK